MFFDFFFGMGVSLELSKTLELVPAVKGNFYFIGIAERLFGCEAGSYLQGVETSLSAFSF